MKETWRVAVRLHECAERREKLVRRFEGEAAVLADQLTDQILLDCPIAVAVVAVVAAAEPANLTVHPAGQEL